MRSPGQKWVMVAATIGAFMMAGCQTPSGGSGSNTSSMAGSSLAGAGLTASAPGRDTRTSFLTDYARMVAVPGSDGARCWRAKDVDLKRYDKILLTRVVVTLRPGQVQHVDPSDLKALLDYFHAALVSALKPDMQVVDKPGPGVLVMRIALTNLTPTNIAESLAGTAIPYGYVLDVGSGAASGLPVGATPYLGETGIEVQFRDGATHAILGECVDNEVGRKYAADLDAGAAGAAKAWVNGYLGSFTSWTYAKSAFDKWSQLLARRLAQLRAS